LSYFVAIVYKRYFKKLGMTCPVGCSPKGCPLRLRHHKDIREHAMVKHQKLKHHVCHCGGKSPTLKKLHRHMKKKAHSQPGPVEQQREVTPWIIDEQSPPPTTSDWIGEDSWIEDSWAQGDPFLPTMVNSFE